MSGLQGIQDLYISFTTDAIELHVKRHEVHLLSRAKIEHTILQQIDKAANLDTEYKLAWYDAVSLHFLASSKGNVHSDISCTCPT